MANNFYVRNKPFRQFPSFSDDLVQLDYLKRLDYLITTIASGADRFLWSIFGRLYQTFMAGINAHFPSTSPSLNVMKGFSSGPAWNWTDKIILSLCEWRSELEPSEVARRSQQLVAMLPAPSGQALRDQF